MKVEIRVRCLKSQGMLKMASALQSQGAHPADTPTANAWLQSCENKFTQFNLLVGLDDGNKHTQFLSPRGTYGKSPLISVVSCFPECFTSARGARWLLVVQGLPISGFNKQTSLFYLQGETQLKHMGSY